MRGTGVAEACSVTTDEIVDAIAAARARNNQHWMALLRLAFRVAPAETRAVFARIQQTDSEVVALTKRLVEESEA